jgi:hypothetical protein
MAISEKIYKPPKWLFYLLITAFIFVTFLIFMVREISFTTITLALMALLFVAALIELSLSKVTVNESCVEIAGFFKKEKILISEITKAKIEDHELFLHLKNDTVRRMPYWFTGKNSLQKILSNRIKR